MEHPVTPSPSWNHSLSGLPILPASLHPNISNVTSPATSLPGGLDLNRSLALCAMLIIDVLAVVGNLAVMIVITKTPQLRKFSFVFHLCLVDLLAALVVDASGDAVRPNPCGRGAVSELPLPECVSSECCHPHHLCHQCGALLLHRPPHAS
ncbi:hypothetical protein KUCAC02_012623 [Chaenocephalus aceratus]|uniref:Uncharacterized protein n=1 Tax=Chaenocephalus aceratus TaxID=36190 RepID=A0ACB9XD41_CHAAC|nr:hypothetical protein KUCAC02_012623 [Chaenocephalus aceratus]